MLLCINPFVIWMSGFLQWKTKCYCSDYIWPQGEITIAHCCYYKTHPNLCIFRIGIFLVLVILWYLYYTPTSCRDLFSSLREKDICDLEILLLLFVMLSNDHFKAIYFYFTCLCPCKRVIISRLKGHIYFACTLLFMSGIDWSIGYKETVCQEISLKPGKLSTIYVVSIMDNCWCFPFKKWVLHLPANVSLLLKREKLNIWGSMKTIKNRSSKSVRISCFFEYIGFQLNVCLTPTE